jgi:hypothetical protein
MVLYCVSFFALQGEKRGCPLGGKELKMTGKRCSNSHPQPQREAL